jgi:TolB-like protein
MAIAAAIVLAALAGGAWYYRTRLGGETIDSVAVLPFVNASGDPNTEYLSDGIAESLINNLSQLPHLKVMSRESAFHYKGKETDARTIGTELGVRAVFEGRVMQEGDNLGPAVQPQSIRHFRAAKRHRQGNHDGAADAPDRRR